MHAVLGGPAASEGLALGLAIAVFLAGFRHGFDIDHIAAIGDITSSQRERKRALVLATTYALGHMLVVFALGMVAVLAGKRVSDAIDSFAGQLIGLTLIALGLYVAYSLIRFRRDFRMMSSWMLVLAGVRRVLHRFGPSRRVVIEHVHEHSPDGHHDHAHDDVLRRVPGTTSGPPVATATRLHVHAHTHVLPMPPDPFTEYGLRAAFVVGMVHGVGAETPTQVLLFTTTAGVAGTMAGAGLVAAFVFGLLAGNSVLAVATTLGFAAGKRVPVVYIALAAVTAVVSIAVGVSYLFPQAGASLPSLGP